MRLYSYTDEGFGIIFASIATPMKVSALYSLE